MITLVSLHSRYSLGQDEYFDPNLHCLVQTDARPTFNVITNGLGTALITSRSALSDIIDRSQIVADRMLDIDVVEDCA